MAEVKWIKITTDIFRSPKIMLLREAPDGNNIVLIWIMLLTIAGRCNSGGRVMLTERKPYTVKMLAYELKFEESVIQLALNEFEDFDMIHFEDDVITITGWEEYQNIEGLEMIREKNRIRKQKQREKEKELFPDMSRDSHVTVTEDVTQCHAIDIDIEEDKEIRKRIQYQHYADMYNSLCPSLPSVKTLSDANKKSIKARLNKYTDEDFKTLFTKAEASDFLKGANNKDWNASFDWLIKDSNFAKVLNGNYDNKPGKPKQSKSSLNNFNQREYDQDAIKRAIQNKQNPPKTAGEDEGIKAKADALKELLNKKG